MSRPRSIVYMIHELFSTVPALPQDLQPTVKYPTESSPLEPLWMGRELPLLS